ncbi:unnamed protein product [Urochloa humidicola]
MLRDGDDLGDRDNKRPKDGGARSTNRGSNMTSGKENAHDPMMEDDGVDGLLADDLVEDDLLDEGEEMVVARGGNASDVGGLQFMAPTLGSPSVTRVDSVIASHKSHRPWGINSIQQR